MTTRAAVLCDCPHCGGPLVVSVARPVEASSPAGTVRTVRTVLNSQDSTDSTYCTAAAPQLTLPLRASRMAKASIWKRAIAIAGAAVDAYPTCESSQTETFKQLAAAQGLDYGVRGGRHQRPLYASALDYVRTERARGASR